MSPKEKLAALEATTVDQLLSRLEKMAADYADHDYLRGCSLVHLEEQTKLAHRVRSLINPVAVA